MKKALVIAAAFMVFFSVHCSAAESNYELVCTTYVVQNGDTLASIADEYIQKNTYGARDIREFIEGIKELNNFSHDREVKSGEEIKINYWIKK